MHQANRDTRLRMACIDHANLAGARQRRRGAGRRFKPYIPGGKRKRKIDGETLSLASPVPSRGPSITLPSLSLSFPSQLRRESTDVRAERDRREEESRRACETSGTRGGAHVLRVCECERERFFNEIYYRTPNAPGQGRGKPESVPFSASTYAVAVDDVVVAVSTVLRTFSPCLRSSPRVA